MHVTCSSVTTYIHSILYTYVATYIHNSSDYSDCRDCSYFSDCSDSSDFSDCSDYSACTLAKFKY